MTHAPFLFLSRVRHRALAGALATAALCALSPSFSHAADAVTNGTAGTLDRVRQRDRLVVGNKMKFATFNVKNPATGRCEGYMADVAYALSRRMLGDEGKVEFRETTDDTRFDMLAKGEVDVLIDLTTTSEEKEKLADFSEEIFRSGSGLLVRRGSPIRGVNGIRRGTRVIYVRDNTDVAYLKAKAPQAVYIEYDNSNDAFAALRAGQGDVFTQVVTHLFRAASQDPAYAVVARFTDKPYFIAVREGDLAMRDAIDEQLRAMRSSGEMDRLYAKWFGPLGGQTRNDGQP